MRGPQPRTRRITGREAILKRTRWRILIAIVLLLTIFETSLAADSAWAQSSYPTGSWGLGVVVPDGSTFSDGSHLSWTTANSVMVTFSLPNITSTDYPVLAVESLMADDGGVMQVAAGIYAGNSEWFSYGWFVSNVSEYSQSYRWTLNASTPAMMGGDHVTLSIYRMQGRWQYRVADARTHEEKTGDYGFNIVPRLRAGDQEVFALESYSTTNAVFAPMSNLTFEQLSINGKQVTAGWYGYGSWDTHHSPLFVVGGLNPPSFISLREVDTTWVWSYEPWSAPGETQTQGLPLTIVVGVPAIAGLLLLAYVYVGKSRRHND